MAAKILIISDSKNNELPIIPLLTDVYHSLFFAKNIEEALVIINAELIDMVIIDLPISISKIFLDYFSVLKQLCYVIPIFGIYNQVNKTNINEFAHIGLNDIFPYNIEREYLYHKINIHIYIKNSFDNNLLNNMHFNQQRPLKIGMFFCKNVNFLDNYIKSKAEIIKFESYNDDINIDHIDLFAIHMNSKEALQCCASLHLQRYNKYTPIILLYDNAEEEANAIYALNMKIGCIDIVNTNHNPYIISCRLISLMKYKQMYENFSNKLKKSIYLSAIDSVSGVYNRSFFDEYMKNYSGKIKKSAIAIIDIDKFKSINDNHGHSFADSMLKHVANTIKRNIRASDIIARYGGDEFVIFMEALHKKTVEDIANRIHEAIKNASFQNIQCSLSIGICYIDTDSISINKAISIADEFMYISKQNGGNSINICD